MRTAYHPLGLSLRLQKSDLENIRDKYPGETNAEQALEDVLLLWLDQKYNVKKFGAPTWRILVVAIARKGGGNDPQLAQDIALKHPAGVYTNLYIPPSTKVP